LPHAPWSAAALSGNDLDRGCRTNMIPKWIPIVLFLFSVYFIGFQHTRVLNKRNILNLRFGLAVGGVVMAVITNFWSPGHPILSVVFLAVAIGWVCAGIKLWRLMPPPPPRPARF
jgi:FtsH-binding integral membrane protein